jgi:hypothetical protein
MAAQPHNVELNRFAVALVMWGRCHSLAFCFPFTSWLIMII